MAILHQPALYRASAAAGFDGPFPLIAWEDYKAPLFESDTLRFTFAGVAMSTACAAGPLGTSGKIISGTLNGNWDTTVSCLGSEGSHTVRYSWWASNTTCTGAAFDVNTLGTGPRIDADWAGFFGSAGGVRIYVLSPPRGIILFEASIALCDFREGVSVSNLITAPGTYATAYYGSGQSMLALASGGSVTISRVACVA
jgi:hypothetical protein